MILNVSPIQSPSNPSIPRFIGALGSVVYFLAISLASSTCLNSWEVGFCTNLHETRHQGVWKRMVPQISADFDEFGWVYVVLYYTVILLPDSVLDLGHWTVTTGAATFTVAPLPSLGSKSIRNRSTRESNSSMLVMEGIVIPLDRLCMRGLKKKNCGLPLLCPLFWILLSYLFRSCPCSNYEEMVRKSGKSTIARSIFKLEGTNKITDSRNT